MTPGWCAAAPWKFTLSRCCRFLTFTQTIPFSEHVAVATDYLTHTWSLAVEEQFYLFWPLLTLVLARRFLAGVDNRRLTCPGIVELCQKTGDYRALAEVARQQDNAVHFLAGLIAAGK